MKKNFVYLITVIFLLSMLVPLQVNAQCGEPVPTEPDTTGPVGGAEISFWHTMTPSEVARMQTLIDAFTKKTNISVVIKYIDPNNAYAEYVKTFSEKNGTPDVFRVDSQYVTKLAYNNMLLALDSNYNETILTDFIPQLLNSGRYVNKIWGIPQTAEIYGLLYNVHQLSNYSINPQFTNLNAFKSAITILGSDYQHGNYGFMFGSMVEGYLPFMWGKGGDFFNGTINVDKMIINNAEAVSGLEFVKSLIDMAETPELEFNEPTAMKGLQYGNISMTIDSTGAISSYLAGPMFNKTTYATVYGTSAPSWVGPSNLGIAMIPGDTNKLNGSLIGGYSLVGSAKTNHSAEVKSFIEYMTSVDTEVLLSLPSQIQGNNFYPARFKAIGNVMIDPLIGLKNHVNNTKSYPAVPYLSDLKGILNENLKSYFNNGQSSQNALDNVSVNWKKVIQNFKPNYDDPNVLKRTIPGFELLITIPVLILGVEIKRSRKKS